MPLPHQVVVEEEVGQIWILVEDTRFETMDKKNTILSDYTATAMVAFKQPNVPIGTTCSTWHRTSESQSLRFHEALEIQIIALA